MAYPEGVCVFTSHFVTTQDGLRLHVRAYGVPGGPHLPVVCLHGLARTSADFDSLAKALASNPQMPRQVLAMDYRGRGLSDYDPDPAKYNLGVELGDVLAVLTAFGVARAVFVGTSRGGLLTMLLAAVRPDMIAGAVLNDIGPVIEPAGLLRIKGYVGKLSSPASFTEAGEQLRKLFGAQFTGLTTEDWGAWARRTFDARDGKLVPCYDTRLAETLKDFDGSQPLPPLWPQFDALARGPVLVIRGETSDLLSRETVAAMRERGPNVQVVDVPAQGHAPLLMEDDSIGRISEFVAACERQTSPA